MPEQLCFSELSDSELLAEVKRLAECERGATGRLIRSLMELDKRRLYLSAGCPSLFVYCTRVLHLSEHAAYGRIEAARAAFKFPQILHLLEQGMVTLTTVTLIGPVLTPDNVEHVLHSAKNKSRREVELLLTELRPQPSVPSMERRLPVADAPLTSGQPLQGAFDDRDVSVGADPAVDPPVAALPPVHRPMVKPISGAQYRLQVTLTREAYDKLCRLRALLRHTFPDGNLALILDRALTTLLREVEKAKCGTTRSPSAGRRAAPGSRAIPAAVKREVWRRDGGQCAFIGSEGRCGEIGFLEYHHVIPFADGGLATVGNVQLRCRAHNQFEAQHWLSMVTAEED